MEADVLNWFKELFPHDEGMLFIPLNFADLVLITPLGKVAFINVNEFDKRGDEIIKIGGFYIYSNKIEEVKEFICYLMSHNEVKAREMQAELWKN